MKTDADLAEVGKAAAAEAMRLWYLDVRDPSVDDLISGKPEALRCRSVIDELLTAVTWRGFVPYAGNHSGPEWCGVLADACLIRAGMQPRWNAEWFGSTLRLHAWAHYQPNPVTLRANPPPTAGEPRRLVARLGPTSKVADLAFTPRPGDVVVIGRVTDKPELRVVGRHIEVVVDVDLEHGILRCVGGNAGGNGPDGKPREGITISDRHIGPGGHNGDHVMWVYRPAPSDLS